MENLSVSPIANADVSHANSKPSLLPRARPCGIVRLGDRLEPKLYVQIMLGGHIPQPLRSALCTNIPLRHG
jgi:hypothetical protein